MNLEQHVELETKRIRKILADANVGSEFRFDIEVSGRVQQGDVLVAYKIGDSYGFNQVTASSIDAAIEEYLRRRGWTARNKPLCISYDGEPVPTPTPDEDEVPF